MRLKTFGGLVLEQSDFTRIKPLLLLAYLTLEGSKDRRYVAEFFWPTAADGLNSLSRALSQIRKGVPDAVAALEYLKSLEPYAPEGILNASSGDMRELFLNGSLATEWWPALEQPTLQKSSLDWDFVNGTAPEGKTPVGTYGGWNLVIYEQSENKEAAWKFIEFLTRPDVNGRVVDLIPANIEEA